MTGSVHKALSAAADGAAHALPQPNRSAALDPASAWIPAGGLFEVDGLTIDSGMAFVGKDLQALDGRKIEPALINPQLKVDWRKPDVLGSTMGYWPAYDQMTPGARAAYLAWLGSGRSDPDVYIGYVFVFFYGVERKLLSQASSPSSDVEVHSLVEELERLLQLYESNRSFAGYCGRLLDYARTIQSIERRSPLPTAIASNSWEVPFEVRAAIGQLIAEGNPIPAEWSLTYLRHHPAANLRTPAVRCADIFDRLFVLKYRASHKEGIRMTAPRARLGLSYAPASAGIPSQLTSPLLDIPDVSATPHLIEQLRLIANECSDALDSYSRFLGRHPGKDESLEAIALLPTELVSGLRNPDLDRLTDWTAAAMAGQRHTLCQLSDLIDAWSPHRRDKLDKRSSASLASLLSTIGVGIEPDVRFGGSTPKADSSVVLFQLLGDTPSAPSQRYAAASSIVHLTAIVANADGKTTFEEQQRMAEYLEDVLALEQGERNRLEAHLSFLANSKTTAAGIKKKVASLAQMDLAAVGRFLIDVAASDGVICPAEIAMLVKVFPHLGLTESSVYSAIHSLGAGEDSGPVQVSEASAGEGWQLPHSAEDAASEPAIISLDMSKVRARKAESSKVAAMLADIFAEDHEEPAAATSAAPVTSPVGPSIEGLDAAHSELAIQLSSTTVIDRESAIAIGKSLGLPLLDGALDMINEVSLDLCGEPLIEGFEDLETNSYAKENIFQ